MSRLSASDTWTGDYLVERGMITLKQFDEATDMVETWDASLSDVVMARRWVAPLNYYAALAQRFGINFVDLRDAPPEQALLNEAEVDDYMRELTMPWRMRGDRLVIATARPGPEAMLYIRRRFGRNVDLVVTAKFDILWSLQKCFGGSHSHRAVYELADTDPEMSAQTVFTRPQVLVAWLCLTALCLGLALAPIATLIAVNAVMSLFYLSNFVFKGVLVWAGGRRRAGRGGAIEAEARLLRDDDLPIYTILVPMFREPEVLPILAGALRKLDYPLAKLDIKIVLEEGDHETIDAAKKLGLEGIFEIVRVPASQPQTKPKACNYALRYARGEYLVIFDAEDKPEPDQLRKVVAAFRQSGPEVACVQCRLNYYNASENWLTRMFTLDYSLWFDLMLPGLERLGIPIPLGGTSNHFKIDVLRELHAWDPFNVTEDADLGIRMTQKGYRVRLVESTTFEEANVSQRNWIRQRSRWIKGYMQTFLVHTRRPLHLMKTVGPLGTLGFIAFIGGTVLAGLLNPIFWGVFAFWAITQTSGFDLFLPPLLLYLSLLNLLLGNGMFIFLMMLAPFRRQWVKLAPYSLSVIWYWALLSIASWKGAWQLITKPFYWEKTQHGISKHTAMEVAKALKPEPTA
jgi:glycosyltransferase XagB